MNKRAIVHVEIPAKDREVTAKFYSDLFGWEFRHMSEPAPYTMFETGNIGGGYPDVSENTKPGDVLVYIASDDIDADLKKIEGEGGRVRPDVVVHLPDKREIVVDAKAPLSAYFEAMAATHPDTHHRATTAHAVQRCVRFRELNRIAQG